MFRQAKFVRIKSSGEVFYHYRAKVCQPKNWLLNQTYEKCECSLGKFTYFALDKRNPLQCHLEAKLWWIKCTLGCGLNNQSTHLALISSKCDILHSLLLIQITIQLSKIYVFLEKFQLTLDPPQPRFLRFFCDFLAKPRHLRSLNIKENLQYIKLFQKLICFGKSGLP